ncbi:MAG TPA: nucleotidyl transferase AbiEii/AbiGii toxin family protein [Thermoanaerobaculia bacterium]|nr:nucleotidyl transferase AbiEii/AbiGii toxin family protein [Thermoanaerobaculia bacterium]
MTRLAARARALGIDSNALLARFVIERFLYRLSRSRHVTSFVLKGATLMPLWLGDSARPTRDADLAGYGDMSATTLHAMFREMFEQAVEPDGVSFEVSSIGIAPIRANDQYGGQRMTATARIGRSRVALQIDVGIGDAVSPQPAYVELPVILDFPSPRLRAYRPETSIAEKFHAMATLGTATSRMKDFYDIDRLCGALPFEASILRHSIEETFRRRGTKLPEDVPASLTDSFAASPDKQKQWRAFARRVAPDEGEAFADIVERIRRFIMPVMMGVDGTWTPGGPWTSAHRSRK